MKFTLIYIIVLVIFSVNGVLSGSRKLKAKNNEVLSDAKKLKAKDNGALSGLKTKALPSGKSKAKASGKSKAKALADNLGKSKAKGSVLANKSHFCDGKTQSDGTQNPDGSCSLSIQGDIPCSDKMPSVLIICPDNGEKVKANKKFDVNIAVTNLVTGKFSDPDSDYNIEPQALDDRGVVLGHAHVTIQRLKDKKTPPDSKQFAFFKGVNDPADSEGILTVTVEDDGKEGLPAGSYRICAVTSSFSHQPIVMPVAKRGSQDDCIRITSE